SVRRLLAFREFIGDRRRRKYLRQEVRQLPPFFVVATAPDRQRQRLKALERRDFRFQFGNRARGRRLIEDGSFGLLDFVFGRVLQVLDIFFVENRRSRRRFRQGDD